MVRHREREGERLAGAHVEDGVIDAVIGRACRAPVVEGETGAP